MKQYDPAAAKWVPDKTLLKQLEPATPAGEYQIRPPSGYAAQTKPGPGGATGYSSS